MHFLIALFLSLAIGAVLGMLGGGGSTLTLPMLIYVLGISPNAAISASLFVVCLTSAIAALAHARGGRVAWRAGAVFGLGGMVGAYAGGWIGRFIPARIVLCAFAGVMIVTALAMMRGRRRRAAEQDAGGDLSVSRSVALGTGVGALSGVLGAGGGFLIVPALEMGGGLALREAIATSPLVTAIQALAGFAGRLGEGPVDWRLVGAISSASILGCVAGAKAAPRLSPVTLRRGFAWLILAVATLVLVKQAPANGADLPVHPVARPIVP